MPTIVSHQIPSAFKERGFAILQTMAAPKQKACNHLECVADKPDSWLTWPNLVTVVRTLATVILVSIGVWKGSELLLFVGLGVYWLGDMADGALARLLGQETRTGAVFDILSDRLCVALFYVSYAGFHHDMIVPIGIFLFNFMLVDNQLSLAFLKWPIMSPNYFYAVDKLIYKLNWSPLAKSTNTSLFLFTVVLTHLWWLAALIALFFLALKLYSTVLVARLKVPTHSSTCIYTD
jgi:CDP-diacylglycerol---glycerol-3-phosphate 3-phosphatidyltransferase